MNKKGFTLIEMVTVMAILSIISIVTVTGYTYSARQEMQRFAQQISEAIQVMQQKASMENAVYILDKREEDKDKYIFVKSGQKSIFSYKVPKQLDVEMNVEEIEFAQDMSPAQAGTIWVKHQTLPYCIKMTIRPVTGLVTIYPLEEI